MERVRPHRTRVNVPGRGVGLVVGVEHSRRTLVGDTRVTVPSRLRVLLANGREVTVVRSLCTVVEAPA